MKKILTLATAILSIASPALAFDPSNPIDQAIFSGQDLPAFTAKWQQLMIDAKMGYVNQEVTMPQATGLAQFYCRRLAAGATDQDIADSIAHTVMESPQPTAEQMVLRVSIWTAAKEDYCPNARTHAPIGDE